MNKWILFLLLVLVGLFSCSTNRTATEPAVPKAEFTTKVAILPLKALDSASRYIQKMLTVRDLEYIFAQHANYVLNDMADIEQKFKSSGYTDVEDLQVDEIKEISKLMLADVIIMGSISETNTGVYNISMRFYSTRSEELKQISFNVLKEKNARWKSLEDNFMKDLDGFISNEMDKIFNIATNYYMNQNYVDAERTLKTVIGLKPDKREAHYYLANTYMKTQKYDLAEQSFLKSLELQPDDQQTIITLIELYDTTNQPEKRIRLMEQLATANDDYELWLAVGNLYSQSGNNAKARESFQKALQINPDYSTAIVRLGFMYYDEENYVEAIPLLEKAFDQAPDNDIIGRRLAISYQKSNRLDQAIARYEGLIKNDPNNVQAYLNVIGLYRTQASDATDPKVVNQLNQKAIDTINALKKVDPENALVYLNLAAIYLSQSKYNDAETNANLALAKNPNLYQPYLILATINQTRGTEQYNKYIDLDQKAAKAVGKEAERLRKERDTARTNANSLFRRADEQLKAARTRTTEAEALNDIQNRINRITQLINQTLG